MEKADEQIECSVCLSILEEDQHVRRLPNCSHVFHMSCIDQWLSGQATCPICRSEVSPQLIPLDREPSIASDLTEVVVVTSEGLEHNIQDVIYSGNNNDNPSKIINAGSGSSSSSIRMSSFRKIIGRERSLSSSRMQVCEEIDPHN
uniref:RING-type E3 ubiquitin transferase n=1 Tax=Chenopodium quinoa TaxID=63459 RepID=A0A803NBJ8_CHEQI